MTDIKKQAQNEPKTKKLRLHKETLKDMRVRKAGPVGGGANQSGKPNC